MIKTFLQKLVACLERNKKKQKDINNNLYNEIFFSLNNLDIRHKNKNGKYKKEYIANILKRRTLKLYYETYYKILDKNRNEFKELKEKFK